MTKNIKLLLIGLFDVKSEVCFSGICVSPSLHHHHLGDHLRFNDDDENDDNDDSLHCHNSGYRCKTFLNCAFKMLLDMLSTAQCVLLSTKLGKVTKVTDSVRRNFFPIFLST